MASPEALHKLVSLLWAAAPFLMAVAGPALAVRSFTRLRTARALGRFQETEIAFLTEGIVEVSGEVCPTQPMLSPLGGAPCVAFRYTIEKGTGTRSSDWTTIAQGSSEVPFFIRGGGDRVLVIPTGAEIVLESPYEYIYEGVEARAPWAIEKFCSRNGIELAGKLLFREWSVPIEGQVFALGRARQLDPAWSSEMPQLAGRELPSYAIAAHGEDPFFLSDQSRRGTIKQLLRQGVWGLLAALLTCAAAAAALLYNLWQFLQARAA